MNEMAPEHLSGVKMEQSGSKVYLSGAKQRGVPEFTECHWPLQWSGHLSYTSEMSDRERDTHCYCFRLDGLRAEQNDNMSTDHHMTENRQRHPWGCLLLQWPAGLVQQLVGLAVQPAVARLAALDWDQWWESVEVSLAVTRAESATQWASAAEWEHVVSQPLNTHARQKHINTCKCQPNSQCLICGWTLEIMTART